MSTGEIDTTPVRARASATPIRPNITSSGSSVPSSAAPEPFDPSIVTKHSVHTLVFRSLKRSHELFLSDQASLPEYSDTARQVTLSVKAKDQYGPIIHLVKDVDGNSKPSGAKDRSSLHKQRDNSIQSTGALVPVSAGDQNTPAVARSKGSLSPPPPSSSSAVTMATSSLTPFRDVSSSSASAIVPKKPSSMPKPEWHAPWKLMRVISGHTGWVRSLAVEPGNEWFASGSNDRIIKIWDLASGQLKISLTGHVSSVRGLAVSSRHPYLFSCGEDKSVKCWDLEYNKVIRHYHGHLSAVYTIALHPTIDVLVTGGRDSCARLWDMRTKAQIHALTGHKNTIASVVTQAVEPQIITGSHDTTIRLWDIVAGKTRATLTHHKKSVRSVVIHPRYHMFASGAPDNIKQWTCPDGEFVQNLEGHSAIVNCLAANAENVLVSGADNGSLFMWDWKSGYNFQRTAAPAQPGSIESEAGILEMTFDQSGCRLITGEADKTIKIWKEDEDASEETHPINWKPDILRKRR